MRKIFALLLCVFITVAVFAASQTTTYYVDTEQKYVFSVDNLSQTIPEFVEDAAKQDAMASKYLELANKETGAVSVKDLFEICEAGGFKPRREEGYAKCREFVVKLLETVEQELEDGTLTGYCPGLDENGKNPNRLKSITGETRVGDFCSSSNIAAGEVVFKKGYNCTCAAYACNNCCESIGGACLTKVADSNGNCLRKEYDNVPNLNVEGAALKFCESKAQRGCKVFSALRNYPSPGKVVCNGTEEERSAVRALNTPCPDTAYAFTNENNTLEKCRSFCIGKAKENSCKSVNVVHSPVKNECICNPDKETVRRLNMKYYEVCGKDKGKSGGSIEECLRVFTDKVYGGTQVSLNIGIALAKEWARVKGYREIECDTKIYDYSSLDDSILCSSIDKDKNGKRGYFEFVFDDLKESKDMTLNHSFYDAVFTRIYGYNKVSENKAYMAWDTKSESNCKKVNESLRKMCGRGCRVIWGHNGNKYCYLDLYTNLPTSERTAKTGPNDFDNPFNIDPFVFCKGAQTQLQNTSSLDVLLKQTISNASGYPMSKIECFAKTTSYCGGGCKCNDINLDPNDDIKECVVHGDKDYYVDFVFDDITEFSKKREKGALQSMGCVVSGGTFNGQECKFANKSQCDTYIKSMSKVCPQCTKPKWNPDTGLCEVPDAAAVTAMEKHEKTAMIIGGVVVSVVVTVATAGSGAPVIAIVLSGVEVAGGAMEYFAQQHIDGMAHDFFLKSAKCNNASCAAKMISENMQEMANIQNDLEDFEINALDAEFERLLGLIEPSSDFYMRIAEKGTSLQDNQKGFFDPDSWNEAQVWRAIGIGLQFVSLGTGAITKIIQGPKFANKFPKMQAMLLKQVKITKQIRDAKKVVNTVDKTADATRNMNPSQAKKLEELNNDIAKIESKANRTPEEAEKLKKLHQERNTLMNKVGTKDADELAKMQKEAFNQKDIQKAQEDYDKIMERRNYVAKYMAEHNGNPPKGTSKQVIREINENVSKAESKLKELGQEVTPMEPLEIGKKPAVKPVEVADTGKVANKADNVADADKGASSVSKPAGKIIEESKTMTRQERQSLLSTLSEEKKLEIARLKVGAGEVKLPFGSTIDDLAKNPDLLELSGEYIPLNQQALNLRSQINRFDNLAEKAKNTGLSTDELTEYNNLLKNGGRESLVSELRYTLSNDISLDALVANGQQYESALIGVVTSDSKMVRQAQNFSKLTKAEQQTFLNNVVNGLDDYFHAGVKPQVKLVDSWTEIGVSAEKDISGIGLFRDNVIYIKPSNLHINGIDGDLNNVMSVIAHEYGHAMDGASAEKVAIGGNAMAKNIIGNSGNKVAKTLKDNMEYVATPTEKSSFAITTVVGENFAKDLEATLKTGKVTTSSLTDLQKYKIMTGFVGDKIKTADKFGVKYYTISSKTADNIQTVMDHFRKVGIEHMTIFEENGEHVLAVFDNASDMKRFEQQIAKVTKATSKFDDLADAPRTTSQTTKGASSASRTAEKATEIGVGKSADNVADAGKGASSVSKTTNKVDNVASSTKSGNKVDEVVNAGRAATKSKTEKIAEARVRGDLGYHGTDADIAMDDMIRSSANSSDQLGGVGYGIARDYDVAEKYAVKRLIERQNVGKNIKFSRQFQGDVLVVDCDEALNLSNKTGYVYTTAKNSDIKWNALQNGYVGVFDAAQMPNSVEILDKTAFNLDDLVRQGKVKINIKSAANKIDNVASGAKNAEKNVNSVVKKSYKDFNWEYKSAAESGLKYSHRRVNLSDLTPNEIDFLKNDLTKQGISFEITSTNKGNLLVVRDGAEVSRSASSVSKAAAVIETPVEEANKLFNIYGLSLENINGLEIPMSRFGNGEKTVNELARLVEKKGGYLQQIGDKIVVRKPGKTGWDLRRSLKEHGIISNRYASDAFHEIHIRSGDQCVSGLKFHVSVNVEDLENASYIVDDLVRRTDVADIWKVYSDGMTGTQKGKDFTIYVSQNGYNSDKIQGFLQELENELKARNIRPNGYGNNIVTGDKPVSGSNYMYYRYDRINASGIPDGEYNSSYNFIAPNAQYGGDIMNGIKVGF